MTPHADLVHSLPLPLAQLLVRAWNRKNPHDLHGNAYFLGEAALKLAAAARISSYLTHAGAPDTELNGRLEALCLPSIGQWVGFLREVSVALGRTGARRAPFADADVREPDAHGEAVPRLLERLVREGILSSEDARRPGRQGIIGFFEVLARYRNEVIGHAGQRSPRYYHEVGSILLDAVCGVLRSPGLFAGHRLGFPRLVTDAAALTASLQWYDATGLAPMPWGDQRVPSVIDGVPGRLYFTAGAVTIPLHPLVVYLEEDDRHRFGFLNRTVQRARSRRADPAAAIRRVQYLDYATGDALPGVEAADALTTFLGRLRGEAKASAEAVERVVLGLSEAVTDADEEKVPGEGRTLGDFELLEELGRGAMGVVYRARQRNLGRTVALKALPSVLAADPVTLGRFRREIRALGAVDHPNVAKILTSGRDGDHLFYAMEFVEGSDLARVQERLSGRRPEEVDARDLGGEEGDYWRKLADLFAQAASGVHELHERGILHRDLKPANLMLTTGAERLVVMDLGLARMAEVGPELSVSGGLLGTPRFAAPEQLVSGQRVDHRADIYGLGASLYELACLAPLYDGDTEERLRTQKLLEEPVAPMAKHSQFPRDLATVVMKCLERDPADRYTDAGALAADLRAFRDDLPVSAQPATFWRNLTVFVRRHRQGVASAAAVFLVMVFATVAFIVKLKQERDLQAELRQSAERALSRAYQEQARRLRVDGSHAQAALAAAVARRIEDSDQARREWRKIVGEPHSVVAALWKANLAEERVEDLGAIVPGGKHVFLVENLFAGGAVSSRVEVRSAQNGVVLASFDACESEVETGTWIDGALLLGTADGSIEVFDVREPRSARRIASHSAHDGRIWLLRFEAGRLWSLGDDQRLGEWPWPLAEGQSVSSLALGSVDGPFSLAVAPSQGLVAVGSMQGNARIWQRREAGWQLLCDEIVLPGEWVRGLEWELEEGVPPVLIAVGSKGTMLAFYLDERVVHGDGVEGSLGLRSAAPVQARKEPISQAIRVGDHLYVGGGLDSDSETRIRAIHLGRRREETELPGHRETIEILAAESSGSMLFSLSRDGTLRAWDLARGPSLWKRERPGASPYTALLALPDGGLLAAAGNRLDRYAATSEGVSLRASWMVDNVVTELSFAGDDVVVLDETDRLQVVDPDSGRRGAPVSLHGGSRCLSADPDGSRVFAITTGIGRVTAVDLATGEAELLPDAGERLGALAFGSGSGPNEGRLFASTLQAGLLLFDGAGWERIAPNHGDARGVSALAISPEGRFAAAADSTGELYIHDLRNGTWHRKDSGFDRWIRRLLWTGSDGLTRLFSWSEAADRVAFSRMRDELEEPELIAPGHAGPLTDFTVLAGTLLVTAGEDGGLRLFDVDLLTRLPTEEDLRRLEETCGFYLDGPEFVPIGDEPLPARGYRSRWEQGESPKSDRSR